MTTPDIMRLPFIKGRELSRLFYEEAVRPLLAAYDPALPYAAARLGGGSDVLGFDTPQSRDHDWGPRLTLFVEDEARHAELEAHLRQHLPTTIRGYPTHYGRHDDGSDHMLATDQPPVNHRVILTTVRGFFQRYLAYEVDAPLQPVDWLTFGEQPLRTIRHGRVFEDRLGRLTALRAQFHYYPRDVWLYLLAGQWRRIAQEEAFVGRCGDVGDDLGSRLIASRQVQNLMRLAFLMAREYAPYAKWFGSAFQQLPLAAELTPLLEAVWPAADWAAREAALGRAYQYLAVQHNQLGLTEPLETIIVPFFKRPYRVLFADRFVEALREQIRDPAVRQLPEQLGAADQLCDSTDVLSHAQRRRQLKQLFV